MFDQRTCVVFLPLTTRSSPRSPDNAFWPQGQDIELDEAINVLVWSHPETRRWGPGLNQILLHHGGANAVSREAIAALQSHPQFVAAVRESASRSVELHRSERLAGWILGDRAQALFGHMALYLHATRDEADPRSGLTATRLKELVVGTGVCSAGRASAMLGLMRAAGYVAAAPGEADRRVRRLVPGERMMAMVRTRMTLQFKAVAPLLPEAADALPLMHDSAFNYALVRALGDYFTAGFRILAHAPGLALFAERNSGVIILFSILLSGDAGGAFPPDGPVPVSIAETARRFGVSRTHVLRLFREAEEADLLTRTGARGEAIELAPEVTQSLLDFFATVFLYLGAAARAALAEFRQDPPRGLYR